KIQDALKELQQSVRNEPESTVAHYYLGAAYLRANDRLKAESEWTEGARSGGAFAQLYLSLAELKLNSGDAESAARYARQAVNINANLPEARLLLAMATNNAEEFRTAAVLFDQSVKRNPDDAVQL